MLKRISAAQSIKKWPSHAYLPFPAVFISNCLGGKWLESQLSFTVLFNVGTIRHVIGIQWITPVRVISVSQGTNLK